MAMPDTHHNSLEKNFPVFDRAVFRRIYRWDAGVHHLYPYQILL